MAARGRTCPDGPRLAIRRQARPVRARRREWRYASVTQRDTWRDGRIAYHVAIDGDGSLSVVHRACWWGQPGIRVAHGPEERAGEAPFPRPPRRRGPPRRRLRRADEAHARLDQLRTGKTAPELVSGHGRGAAHGPCHQSRDLGSLLPRVALGRGPLDVVGTMAGRCATPRARLPHSLHPGRFLPVMEPSRGETMAPHRYSASSTGTQTRIRLQRL